MSNGISDIYQNVAERTGGDIYLGVVGPVRTGKSTFVKRFMEALVIPHIENVYQQERARDELPQSGSGKTIMTSEPKFVPEEAVEISPDGITKLTIRLIDSVGYMIPGVLGAEEDGKPRMITTPWFDQEVPMSEAAELGTRKVMTEHCTIGIVMTTDGSIHELSRQGYVDAEQRAISDMKETGKPFLVLVNSSNPKGDSCRALCKQLQEEHHVHCIGVNCLTMCEEEICEILKQVLYEFPITEMRFYMPPWVSVLPFNHAIRETLYQAIGDCAEQIKTLSQSQEILNALQKLDFIEGCQMRNADLGSGCLTCELLMPNRLFYEILSEETGFTIENEAKLFELLHYLADMKKKYDKVSTALEQVQATGYGIVMPTPDEIKLEQPQIIRRGGNYGVKLKASAPSIHMMRADIQTEINPIVGDEKQSEDLLQYLLQEYEDNTEKLWDSNIFGKSVFELVNDGLNTKLMRMPEESRYKLQATLGRIINEGSSGLICIILE